MSRGKEKTRGDGRLSTWRLVFMIVAGVSVMIYENAVESISNSIPGSRERRGKAGLRAIDRDLEGARKLAKALAADLMGIDARLVEAAERRRQEMERHLAEGGWLTDLDPEGDLWDQALRLLSDAGRVAVLDWKSDPDEVKETLAPLLRRYGVAIDWSFVAELEQAENWKALETDNFVKAAGKRVAALGYVVVKIFDGSDGFSVAVCTPAEFAPINGLSDSSGTYSVCKV